MTTTGPDRMIVGFFGLARSMGITAPAGMTEHYQAQAADGAAETKTTSEAADVTQATGNKTATAAQGADWVAQLVALRPAAAAPRSTSTTVDSPTSTPANSPATCTVRVTDTASGTKSPGVPASARAGDTPPSGSFPMGFRARARKEGGRE